MKQVILFFSFLVTLNFTSTACTCGIPYEPFCTAISRIVDSGWSINLIKAKIISFEEYDMYVTVEENILGEITADTIKVIGQDGVNCNQWLLDFTEGQQLILRVDMYSNENYGLSGCSHYFLFYDEINNIVSGPIRGEQSENVHYEDFIEFLPECMDFPVSLKIVSKLKALKIFPNPANDQIRINNFEIGKASYTISILNTAGTVVKTITHKDNGHLHIPVGYLPKGIYFVRIVHQENSITKRLLLI